MIKQSAIGLNSRSEVNPFNEDGFLPLITAPMYSVVDESNYQIFLDNKIQVCLPRRDDYNIVKNVFNAMSLEKFIEIYVSDDEPPKHISYTNYVCIDTANGNMPALHKAIREAKEIHEDKLIIMAGNVASVDAFVELAKTGVDYIRVGIGGGGGCNTTANVGVGQKDLGELVHYCNSVRKENPRTQIPQWYTYSKDWSDTDIKNINNVKIVADGISSYINLCQQKYGFNDNGYAAINKLLDCGADLVMVGKLFAQCVESAGSKGFYHVDSLNNHIKDLGTVPHTNNYEILLQSYKKNNLFVKYSGMSTQEEQRKYKPLTTLGTKDLSVPKLRPSEGSIQWIPVLYTLPEWLKGSANQDQPPYLMGWINSYKSYKSYTA